MISGIGIDIEMISRVASVLEQWSDAFVEKVFTGQEKKYCMEKGNPPQHLAARFAAKEAFAKAIGTGWGGVFRWRDVEVINDEFGKPSIRLHKELAKHLQHASVHLSLSHTADYVAAVVVIENNHEH
jgi:holo-[acyl-carrier protein] synthase